MSDVNDLAPAVASASAATAGPTAIPGQLNPQVNESTPSISAPSVDDGTTSEHDSAIDGISITSSTTSLRPSIYEHVEENGRTYHRFKEGKYMMPNDLQEQERLDLQHILMGIMLEGRLGLAPLPQNFSGEVLDLATGTGIWAIDFANLYPNCNVTGTDLSAIQPSYLPPNCNFIIDDAEDEWVFPKQFDYIHGRALLTCFKDPKEVFRSAYNALKPGGYLELQDGCFPLRYVGEPPVDSHIYKWMDIVTQGAAKAGRPWTRAQYYKQWLEELGFEDVKEKFFYLPTSQWAKGKYFKELAMYFQEDLLNATEGISLKTMAVMGWKAEDIREFLVGVKEDIKNKNIHAYLLSTVVYGRKPMTS